MSNNCAFFFLHWTLKLQPLAASNISNSWTGIQCYVNFHWALALNRERQNGWGRQLSQHWGFWLFDGTNTSKWRRYKSMAQVVYVHIPKKILAFPVQFLLHFVIQNFQGLHVFMSFWLSYKGKAWKPLQNGRNLYLSWKLSKILFLHIIRWSLLVKLEWSWIRSLTFLTKMVMDS